MNWLEILQFIFICYLVTIIINTALAILLHININQATKYFTANPENQKDEFFEDYKFLLNLFRNHEFVVAFMILLGPILWMLILAAGINKNR